ncbi:MAG: amidohydrolase [Bacteroidales bacterium]|nr:amidohydrolase [Bacteroidales bacterium]MBQ3984936.1 amidohydrolase [Bacteroidales bacterium]MBQ4168422.1 amidohydrolase [Bacteroidales bacterium]MBQ5415808.1 amidohydrolase [Bacteroidales bacterium]
MIIIDAHSHLWLRQEALVDGHKIYSLPGGRSMFFGEVRQMLPPFMTDGTNTAEVFLANMDYAQVGAAVVVQEVIDGNQDAYLKEVQAKYPDRFLCCSLLDIDKDPLEIPEGFRAVAIPGHRMKRNLTDPALVAFFKDMEAKGQILSMCLDDNAAQIAQFKEVIQECPDLKVAIGHFGMVTGKCFEQQVKLAEAPNVYVEAGGITWLYNSEFYPYPSAVRSIRQAADWVGMDKLMWGSDYPRTICAITYKMSYDFVLKSNELSQEEKEAFLGLNAKRFYGFGEVPQPPYIKNMSE